MSGHGKWLKIRRFKGALDVKRGRCFPQLSKEITIASRLGGGNPGSDPRLCAAIPSIRCQSIHAEEINYEARAQTDVAPVIATTTAQIS